MNRNWTYKKIGEIGTLLRGKGIQKTDFIENGQPCIHYGQIHTVFDVSTDRHLSTISSDLYKKSILASTGDVLLTLTSEDVEGSCKSTAWLGNYDVAVSSDAAILKHSLNPKFFVYYTRSNSFYAEKSKYARGFKVTHIKTSDIAEIPIPVPSQEEQSAIVSEFDRINELITLKKKQLIDLDFLSKSIFYDMFGDPIENEKGWELKYLGDVCDATSSKRIFAEEYKESGIPFYRGKEITERSKNIPISVELYISKERYEEIKRAFGSPKVGDLLITAVGTIGNIWVVDDYSPFYFKDGNIIWIRNITNINSIFFKSMLEILIDAYKKEMVRGAAYSALTIVNLKKMSIPLPPLTLQQSFANRISSIEQQKQRIDKSIKDLETLLASRMQFWFD